MMRRTLALVAAAAAALALVPVLGSGGTGGAGGVPVVAAQAGLTPFDDCGQLLEHLREAALEQVTPWGLGGGPITILESDMIAGDAAAESAPAAARAETGGDDGFSGTNVQEVGIDEADVVKTDGRVLAVASYDRVTLLDVTSPSPRPLATVPLGPSAGATELFLDGDRLVVITSGWSPPTVLPQPAPLPEPAPGPGAPTPDVLEPGIVEPEVVEPDAPASIPPAPGDPAVDAPAGDDAPARDDAPGPSEVEPLRDAAEPAPAPADAAAESEAFASEIAPAGRPRVEVIDLDIADPSAPVELARLTLDGTHLSSRLVDGRLLVVTSAQETRIPFVFPSTSAGEERALELNRQAIREATLEQFLPTWTRVLGGQVVEEGRSVACDRVYHPDTFAGLGAVQVTAFDAAAGTLAPTSSAAVITSGQTVYASPQRLYVATTEWSPMPRPVPLPRPVPGPADSADDVATAPVPAGEPTSRTDIHAFDIADLGDVRHLASGSVPGSLLNQFSMSEHEGDLRVAVTTGEAFGGDRSESSVHVLRDTGGELRQIGAVGGLGRGERIFAVRFLGDIGYVVTFRQIDPLYTIDLSDPTAPRAVGELKIPGYSAYLHPVADGRLLGVGQAADLEGRTQGLQVSLFDVRDLAAPRQLATTMLPQASSPVEHDHRAFLWWPATATAAMPFTAWRLDETVTAGTAVFDVDPEAGTLTLRGSPSTTAAPGVEYDAPRRVVVVGRTLLAVGERSVQAYDLATLTPTGSAAL